jgi:hypothetical protein
VIGEDEDWEDREGVEVLPDGALRSPEGIVYHRLPKRIRRAECRALVAAGAPVITEVYGEGLRWYEGDSAVAVWERSSPRLLTGPPPRRIDLRWVAHAWESDTGEVILFFVGEH